MISYCQASASSKAAGQNVSAIATNLSQLGPLKRFLAHEHTWWVTFSCFFLFGFVGMLITFLISASNHPDNKENRIIPSLKVVKEDFCPVVRGFFLVFLVLSLIPNLLGFFWRKAILNNKASQAKNLFISFLVFFGVFLFAYCIMFCIVILLKRRRHTWVHVDNNDKGEGRYNTVATQRLEASRTKQSSLQDINYNHSCAEIGRK